MNEIIDQFCFMINELQRRELYDLVWSKPMKKIQEDFGLTYAQLKSICEEYKIPLPASGFWTKIAFGKDVTILPLIEYPNISTVINLHNSIEKSESVSTSFSQIKAKVALEMGEMVKVPKLINSWHPLVARYREKYTVYQKEMLKGRWSNALQGELSIQVRESHFSRATRIFDTIIKIIELKGHTIFIDHFGTNITINKHTYKLSIRTKHKRIIDEDSNYSFQSTKLIPQDILIFKICNNNSFEFADAPSKLLEEKIDAIIARIELMAIEDTKWMELAERQNQIYQQQLAHREAIRKAQEQEKAKFEQLVKDAESWNKALLLNKYLDEIERKPTLTNEEKEYINWGRNAAKSINPLTRNINNIVKG